MAKGIIVVEIPESCDNCSLSEEIREIIPVYICQLKRKSTVETDNRPTWCPLFPMPERIKQVPLSDMNYKRGWNDCVDYLEVRNGE